MAHKGSTKSTMSYSSHSKGKRKSLIKSPMRYQMGSGRSSGRSSGRGGASRGGRY